MKRHGAKLIQIHHEDVQDGILRVPDGIEIISRQVCYHIDINQLILPDTLKIIEPFAFNDTKPLKMILIDTEDMTTFHQIFNILDERLHDVLINNIYAFYEEVAKLEQDSMTSYRFFHQFKKVPKDVIHQEILPRLATKYGLPAFFGKLAFANFESEPELPLTDHQDISFKY